MGADTTVPITSLEKMWFDLAGRLFFVRGEHTLKQLSGASHFDSPKDEVVASLYIGAFVEGSPAKEAFVLGG